MPGQTPGTRWHRSGAGWDEQGPAIPGAVRRGQASAAPSSGHTGVARSRGIAAVGPCATRPWMRAAGGNESARTQRSARHRAPRGRCNGRRAERRGLSAFPEGTLKIQGARPGRGPLPPTHSQATENGTKRKSYSRLTSWQDRPSGRFPGSPRGHLEEFKVLVHGRGALPFLVVSATEDEASGNRSFAQRPEKPPNRQSFEVPSRRIARRRRRRALNPRRHSSIPP